MSLDCVGKLLSIRKRPKMGAADRLKVMGGRFGSLFYSLVGYLAVN